MGMRDRTRLFSSCFCLLTSTNSENDIVDVAKAIAIFPIVVLFKSNSGRVDASLRAVRVVLEGEIVTYIGRYVLLMVLCSHDVVDETPMLSDFFWRASREGRSHRAKCMQATHRANQSSILCTIVDVNVVIIRAMRVEQKL